MCVRFRVMCVCVHPQDAFTVLGKPYGTHQLLKFRTGPVVLAVGSGLATPGYTFIADETVAGELYSLLASKVCTHPHTHTHTHTHTCVVQPLKTCRRFDTRSTLRPHTHTLARACKGD